MAIDWYKERVQKLSDNDLFSLQRNAKFRKDDFVFELCEFEILNRLPKKFFRNGHTKKSENKAVNDLIDLGKELLVFYDLSEKTAKRLSQGTKNFIPHKIWGKSGKPKVGGAQKASKVAFDRYLSYRLKDEVYAILAILYNGEEHTKGTRYQVFGPSRLLKGFIPLNQIRPYLELDEAIGVSAGGLEYETFEEAAEKYKWLIDQVAPKLK